ncbi:MAG: S41 family peptidase [Patescibacteria group bacterium]
MDNKTERELKYTRLVKSVLAIGFTFVIGVIVGQSLEVKDELIGEDGNIDIARVIDLYGKTRSPEVNFDQFWDVWNKVKNKFVDKPVDEVKLFYGALSGMVNGLGDPYSVYLPPEPAGEFVKDLAGEFEGIGAEIGVRDNRLKVIAPLRESPAERAGLRPGDTIFAIDGKETASLSLEEAVLKIRGPKGTAVKLTVSHDGFESVEEIEVIRDTITVPTVYWEMKDDGIAYLRISYFNQDTWDRFDKAVREIIIKSPKGIILDMRSNPGGYLETSVDVASEWVQSGIIVSEASSDLDRRVYNSRGAHRFNGIRTVVLVDGGTASGSEIVAGALQDHGVAKVVGIKTYGKGSVQDFEILPDGSALKLTIARWYTPNNRQIDKEGIAPDVAVEEMFIVGKNDDGEDTGIITDAGLEKALEILNQITNNN